MVDGDTYICEKTSSQNIPTLQPYWITGRTRPEKFTNSQISVSAQTFDSSNNIIECIFTRPDAMSDVSGKSLSSYNTASTSFRILAAQGQMDTSGVILYHGSRTATA